jgi:hypothetical protein
MHVLHWQLQSLGGVFSILQIEQFEQDLAHMDMKKRELTSTGAYKNK